MTLPERHFPVLVTGARGLLATALVPRLQALAPRPEALCLTDLYDPGTSPPRKRRETCERAGLRIEALDITDAAAVERAIGRFRPRTVFNLAAWTNVDLAETHREEARCANVEGAANVARAATAAGAIAVHMSTDYVFGGSRREPYSEDDPPCPECWYGRTKADGEEAVRSAAPASHLIVRAAWLYGKGGPNFVDTVLREARAGRPLRVVADQVGCPTWNEDLSRALVAMVEAEARGTFHACGAGEASRWDLASETVRAAGLAVEVEPITSADLPGVYAPRPARTLLSTRKLEQEVGFHFADWRESVRAYVAGKNA